MSNQTVLFVPFFFVIYCLLGRVMLNHVLNYCEKEGNFDSVYLWVNFIQLTLLEIHKIYLLFSDMCKRITRLLWRFTKSSASRSSRRKRITTNALSLRTHSCWKKASKRSNRIRLKIYHSNICRVFFSSSSFLITNLSK